MHKNSKVQKVGLVILENEPYIAVSPDMEVSCDCCGSGLLEVKCHYTSRDCHPTTKNVSYLVTKKLNAENVVTLSEKRAYLYQVQGQMGVTNTSYCDFFVYSKYGYHLEGIKFDAEFWAKMLKNIN